MTLLSNGTRIRPDDHIILLLGASGSGKSTFIDIASGRKDKSATDSLKPKKPKIRTIRISHPDPVNECLYVLAEAPGLDRTEGQSVIGEFLKDMRKKDIKLSAVIYLHRISDKRVAASPLDNLKRFPKVWEAHNVSLVTTMWDELDRGADESREVQLKALLSPRSQIYRFEDTPMSAWAIIDKAVSGDDDSTLLSEENISDISSQLGESSTELCFQSDQSEKNLSPSRNFFGQDTANWGPTSQRDVKPWDSVLKALIRRWESIFRKLWVAVHQEVRPLARQLKMELRKLNQDILVVFGELEEMRVEFGRSLRMILTFCKKDLHGPNSTTPQLSSRVSQLTLEGETDNDEIYIIVLGHGGSGKSTLINCLTESNLEVFHGIQNCSRPVQMGNAIKWNDQTITLIDTPGIDVSPWYGIMLGIHKLFNTSLRKRCGGLIYLEPIYPRGEAIIPETVLQLAKHMCNMETLERLVIIRTWAEEIHPHSVGDIEGTTIIEYPNFKQDTDVGVPRAAVFGPILGARR